VIGQPVLNRVVLGKIDPTQYSLELDLSEELSGMCQNINDFSIPAADRIPLCRTLEQRNDLPFAVRRWVMLFHVYLAGEVNDPEELRSTAKSWLSRESDSPSATQWVASHPEDPDMKVYVRSYLAHIYADVVNEKFNWSAGERLQAIRNTMLPLFSVKQSTTDMADAHLYYAMCLLQARERLLIELSREVNKEGQTEEQKARLAEQSEAIIFGTSDEAYVHSEKALEIIRTFQETTIPNQEEIDHEMLEYYERHAMVASSQFKGERDRIVKNRLSSTDSTEQEVLHEVARMFAELVED
jgi:hypothetical protein